MAIETHSLCGSCGASIYPEHIDSGIARRLGDKLLCSFCVAEAQEKGGPSGDEPELDAISLHEDDDYTPESSKTRIQLPSGNTLGTGHGFSDAKFKRAVDPRAVSATRCRTFHSKLNEASIEFMNNLINEWLDASPSYTIKFATSTIGVFEGKHSEPHLIVTLFV